jgi:hypothetical protein
MAGPLGLAALGAFLVADIVLVGLAVRSTSAAPAASVGSAGKDRPAADSGVSAGGASTPTTGGTDSAPATTAPAALTAVPLTVGLVAVDDRTAWRFDAGTCADGGSTMAVTDDGGKTWQPRVAPFDVTVRVRVRDNGSAFAIGADDDCKARFRQSDDQAETWDAPVAVPGVWYRDAKDPAVVGTEAGTKGKPCDSAGVVDLAVDDDSATALCGDGQVLESEAGREWSQEATLDGALAIALAGDRTLALLAVPDCAGLAVVDAAQPEEVRGCAPADLTEVSAGQLALAARNGAVWVAAGGAVLRSSGDLAEWTTAG